MATRRGFTLVELLLVMGMVTALMAILLPALAYARHQARVARCGANLHAIGQGVRVYSADWGSGPGAAAMPPPFGSASDDQLPPLYDALASVLPPGSAVYRCPEDRGQVYGRCAAVSAAGHGTSYARVDGRLLRPGDALPIDNNVYFYANLPRSVNGYDIRDLVMMDYGGDTLHGLIVPPIHAGQLSHGLYRDGSVR